MHSYKATVVRIVDADTIEFKIDLGFYMFSQQKIRVAEFDAPETYRPKSEEERDHGTLATEFAETLLPIGSEVTLHTIKKGKYRFVAIVILQDGSSFAELMIENGFAKQESYG